MAEPDWIVEGGIDLWCRTSAYTMKLGPVAGWMTVRLVLRGLKEYARPINMEDDMRVVCRTLGWILWSGVLACGGSSPVVQEAPDPVAVAPADVSAPSGPEALFSHSFRQAFLDFVAAPNAERASVVGHRDDVERITTPETWDSELYERVLEEWLLLVKNPTSLRRFTDIRGPYREVLKRVRQVGLPDVVAAIPYQESRYQQKAVSSRCEVGYWQLMPEAGVRANTYMGLKCSVSDCALRQPNGDFVRWTPDQPVAPVPLETAPYIGTTRSGELECLVTDLDDGGLSLCGDDDRTDLNASTSVALKELETAWADADFATSGAAVQLTLFSYQAGLDASLYGGQPDPKNMKPLYAAWAQARPVAETHLFYGQNVGCSGASETDACESESVLTLETQKYAPRVIALHLYGVCVYATRHANESTIFAEYQDKYVGPNRFCAWANLSDDVE